MRVSPSVTVAAGTLTLCLAGAVPAAAATSPAPPLPLPLPSPVGALIDQVTDATGLPNPLSSPTPTSPTTVVPTASPTPAPHHRHHHHSTTTATATTTDRHTHAGHHETRRPAAATAPASLPAGVSRAWVLPQLPAAPVVQAPADQVRPPVTAPEPPADVTTAVLAAGRVPDLSHPRRALLPSRGEGGAPRTLLLALATAAAVGVAAAHARAAAPRA